VSIPNVLGTADPLETSVDFVKGCEYTLKVISSNFATLYFTRPTGIERPQHSSIVDLVCSACNHRRFLREMTSELGPPPTSKASMR
jgi:hypothetical protein